jgi:hypothetical protein
VQASVSSQAAEIELMTAIRFSVEKNEGCMNRIDGANGLPSSTLEAV